MRIDVLTLFPEMFAPMEQSMMGIAQSQQIIQFHCHNFREHAVNKHGHVDDYPYGGGAGMLLRVEPIVATLETLTRTPQSRVILTTPSGVPFSQPLAQEWSQSDHLIFICGHYEGVDERIKAFITDEVSIGDYVLTNGELPTMVMIDATVRLLPQVIGNSDSLTQESHQCQRLEYPQYTRPPVFRGMAVPDVLLSGHHAKIEAWRKKEALRKTYQRRPDLLKGETLTVEEQKILSEIQEDYS